MRFAALALLLSLATPITLIAQEPTKADLLRAVEKQLQAAHEAAGPAVACVVVSRSDRYPPRPSTDAPGVLGAFDPKQYLKDNPQSRAAAKALDLSDVQSIPDNGFACGVVIDEKGLLLTPYHVIEGATKIYVHLPGRAGSYADILAADARTDLAVLKLLDPPTALKAIKFGDVKTVTDRGRPTVTRGKLVVLMANAFATNLPLDKPSAALGSVTNVYPSLNLPNGKDLLRYSSYYYHGPLLEHDAKLNAGISGAALLNLDGELIGLTTTAPILGLGEKTPDYALPMDERVRRVIAVLCRGEEVESGYLGVHLVTELDPNYDPRIVQIKSAVGQGPAALAGLAGGDVITHINGVRIQRYEDLLTHISAGLAGSKVTVTTPRTREVTVTLGKLKHGEPFIASARPEPVFGLRVDHGSLLAQSKNGRPDIQILADGVPAGVSVAELSPDSPAAAAFKKLGDEPKRWLVTHVNGAAVATPREFYDAAKDQKSVKLTVLDPSEPRTTRKTREVTFP